MTLLIKEKRKIGKKEIATRKAFVLINTERGKAESVTRALRNMTGVTLAEVVNGPYDVIAFIEGAQADDVARMVLVDIPGIKGASHTVTCLVHGTRDSTSGLFQES